MQAKPRILIVGRANMNLILFMDDIPSAGKYSVEKNYEYIPGGSGINTALMLSRLGIDTILSAKIAKDTHGQILVNFCRENDIDTRFIAADTKQRTGLETVFVTERDTNRSVIYPGANEKLNASNVEYALTSLPDALLLNLSSPAPALSNAAIIAYSKKIPVFVNATKCGKISFPLEELIETELFITDEEGVFNFTEYKELKTNTYIPICLALTKKTKAKHIVILQKNDAVLLYTSPYHYIFSPPCEAEIIDPSTASDAFAAALIWEYYLRRDISKACTFASIIQTMTVAGKGGASSIPQISDIPEFISRKNINYQFLPDINSASRL